MELNSLIFFFFFHFRLLFAFKPDLLSWKNDDQFVATSLWDERQVNTGSSGMHAMFYNADLKFFLPSVVDEERKGGNPRPK